MEPGDAVPDATATGSDGKPIALRSLEGPLVVYFYPKDDTTGCTREAQDFSALAGDFAKAGVALIGISRDDVKSHAKFTTKYDLAIPLASDCDGSVTEAFGVWVEKTLYGRKYMGIERATFLFDGAGKLVREWRKVKVAGHASAVLEAAKGA